MAAKPLIGGYRWGMSADELCEHIVSSNISDAFMPNAATLSSITIGNTSIDADIKYGFDESSLLNGIELFFEDSIGKYRDLLRAEFGDDYLIVIPKKKQPEREYYIWYNNDNEYLLFSDKTGLGKPFVELSIVNLNSINESSTLAVCITDFLKKEYKSFCRYSNGKEMSISESHGSDYIHLRYDGSKFKIHAKDDESDLHELTESEMRESNHPYKIYSVANAKLLEVPNGKPVLDEHNHPVKARYVQVLRINGNWVKVQLDHSLFIGWLPISAFEDKPTEVIAPTSVCNNNVLSQRDDYMPRWTSRYNHSDNDEFNILPYFLILFLLCIAVYFITKPLKRAYEYDGSNYDEVFNAGIKGYYIRAGASLAGLLIAAIPLIDKHITTSNVGATDLSYTKSAILGVLYGQDKWADLTVSISIAAIILFALLLLSAIASPAASVREAISSKKQDLEDQENELREAEALLARIEKEKAEYKAKLFAEYGEPERIIYMEDDDLKSAIIAFSQSEKLFVQETVVNYADILSCSIDDDSFEKTDHTSVTHSTTNTDNETILVQSDWLYSGRTYGSGQTETSTRSTGITTTFHHYYLRIYVTDLSSPVIKVDCDDDVDTVHEIYGMVESIIHKNKQKE